MEDSNKTIYIVIISFTVIILLSWGIYLYIADKNEYWPLKPYEPPTTTNDKLYYMNGEDSTQKITDPAIIEKRKIMLEQALIESQAAIDYANSINTNAKASFN